MDTTLNPRMTAITEAAIARLIDAFYDRVRRDAVLGPVFAAAIADDAWAPHIAIMRKFWSSVMLGTGSYSGNPVAVHHAVAGIARPMFAHWLTLFEATAADLFVPELAAEFTIRARRIAGSLEIALFHRLGLPPDGVTLPGQAGP